jgi:hypothetical protein
LAQPFQCFRIRSCPVPPLEDVARDDLNHRRIMVAEPVVDEVAHLQADGVQQFSRDRHLPNLGDLMRAVRHGHVHYFINFNNLWPWQPALTLIGPTRMSIVPGSSPLRPVAAHAGAWWLSQSHLVAFHDGEHGRTSPGSRRCASANASPMTCGISLRADANSVLPCALARCRASALPSSALVEQGRDDVIGSAGSGYQRHTLVRRSVPGACADRWYRWPSRWPRSHRRTVSETSISVIGAYTPSFTILSCGNRMLRQLSADDRLRNTGRGYVLPRYWPAEPAAAVRRAWQLRALFRSSWNRRAGGERLVRAGSPAQC